MTDQTSTQTNGLKKRCDLPGAEEFTKYLIDKADGTISSRSRKDTQEAGHKIRNWDVLEDDQQIGVYSAHDPEQGKEEYARTYKGKVPNYINQTIAEQDECKPAESRRPLDLVELIYSNKRYEENVDGTSRFKETDWKRQDNHTTIPFP